MVQHYVGLAVSDARMLGMDRLGLDMKVTRTEQTFKLRLPFIRWVVKRGQQGLLHIERLVCT